MADSEKHLMHSRHPFIKTMIEELMIPDGATEFSVYVRVDEPVRVECKFVPLRDDGSQ